jgi:hypothetical protein
MYNGGVLALYQEVTPPGNKHWRLQCSFRGRRPLKSPGTFQEVSLQDASVKATAFKKELADSTDPTHKTANRKGSFRGVAIEWADRFLPALAPKTWQKNRANFGKMILPCLDEFSFVKITPTSAWPKCFVSPKSRAHRDLTSHQDLVEPNFPVRRSQRAYGARLHAGP